MRRNLLPTILTALLLTSCTITYTNEGSTVVWYDDTSSAQDTHSVSQSTQTEPQQTQTEYQSTQTSVCETTSNGIPEYSGSPYAVINNNEPYFTDITTDVFETYSDLDNLGRCGVAFANICKEIMPTEDRGQIGNVKPSGWHTVKYNGIISGNYLYNRCHLIGYQLAGENANEKNLITGTRYLNVVGMLPFENQVDDYVESSGNHVLYRVTPIFEGDNLVADGVLMEGLSVEDNGTSVKFCVFCYNVQPGIGIDYATGDSWILNQD